MLKHFSSYIQFKQPNRNFSSLVSCRLELAPITLQLSRFVPFACMTYTSAHLALLPPNHSYSRIVCLRDDLKSDFTLQLLLPLPEARAVLCLSLLGRRELFR